MSNELNVMEYYFNDSSILKYLRNVLAEINHNYMDAGMRSAYLMKCYIEEYNLFPPKRGARIVLLTLCKDIGSFYKSGEVPKSNHALVAASSFSFMHNCSPFGEDARPLLYYMSRYIKDVETENQQIGLLMSLINQIVEYNYQEYTLDEIEALILKDTRCIFNPEHVKNMFKMLKKYRDSKTNKDIFEMLNNNQGLYFYETSKYIAQGDYTPQELKGFIDMTNYSFEFQDSETLAHTVTVASCAEDLARYSHLPDTMISEIKFAALVHDIGKIKVPLEILCFPGKLSDAQFAEMKRHALYTKEILATCFSPRIINIASNHHEKLDGSGYPQGLREVDLSIGDKIVTVADITSALYCKRSYKGAFPPEKIKEIVKSDANNGKIDKRIVNHLLDNWDEVYQHMDIVKAEVLEKYEAMRNEYELLQSSRDLYRLFDYVDDVGSIFDDNSEVVNRYQEFNAKNGNDRIDMYTDVLRAEEASIIMSRLENNIIGDYTQDQESSEKPVEEEAEVEETTEEIEELVEEEPQEEPLEDVQEGADLATKEEEPEIEEEEVQEELEPEPEPEKPIEYVNPNEEYIPTDTPIEELNDVALNIVEEPKFDFDDSTEENDEVEESERVEEEIQEAPAFEDEEPEITEEPEEIKEEDLNVVEIRDSELPNDLEEENGDVTVDDFDIDNEEEFEDSETLEIDEADELDSEEVDYIDDEAEEAEEAEESEESEEEKESEEVDEESIVDEEIEIISEPEVEEAPDIQEEELEPEEEIQEDEIPSQPFEEAPQEEIVEEEVQEELEPEIETEEEPQDDVESEELEETESEETTEPEIKEEEIEEAQEPEEAEDTEETEVTEQPDSTEESESIQEDLEQESTEEELDDEEDEEKEADDFASFSDFMSSLKKKDDDKPKASSNKKVVYTMADFRKSNDFDDDFDDDDEDEEDEED